MKLYRLLVLPFLLIGHFGFAQIIADFESPASTPALSPSGALVVSNPDLSGNASSNVAVFAKPSGNWQAIYLDFSSKQNIGKNDRLTFKIRSSTKGRVYVKIDNNSSTILENWAPDYNSMPLADVWTECSLDISTLADQVFDRLEINASVDNTAAATVYLDDFKLENSQAPNGQPIAVVNVSAYQVEQGQSIHFDGSGSTDVDGSLVAYQWDFNDGATAAGAIVDHAFLEEGIFNVILSVTDNDGKVSSKITTINILPSSGKIGTVSFVTANPTVYKKAEAVFLINGSYQNVYDPEIVKVDALITQPDGTVLKVPCFFYQAATYVPDQWTVAEGVGHWMLRFTATQVGQHHVSIQVSDSDGITTSSSSMIQINTGISKGFIKPDPNNKQYLRRTTGEPFYPLGINVAWDNTTDYTTIFSNLGNGKANLVRYWQVPFDRQGLEWKNGSGFYKGLGVYSQEAAAEQDSMFSISEANNLSLQVTLFQHGMFSETVNSNWVDNPYNSANGGPLTAAEQFFYNTEAKARTKKLLRYIVARWGYSTNLFAWELFNEVNFTGNFPNQTAQWYPGVKTWHDEMGQFVKSLDVFDHPVTTSTDESNLPDFDKLQGLDIVQYHLYNSSLLTVQTTNDKSILASLTRTGLVNGEYGLDVNTADVPFDAQRISIWTGIMNQVPHLMWKWDNYTDTTWSNLFKYPAAFVQGEDFVSEGLLSEWTFTAALNAEQLVTRGFKSNRNFYGIIYDKIYRSGIDGGTINFSGVAAGNYTITYTDITTGKSTTQTIDLAGQSPVALPQFSKGLAVKGKFNYDIVLGTDEVTYQQAAYVYPNPSSGILYLRLPAGEVASKIEIVNMLGVTQFSPMIHVENQPCVVSVDLREGTMAYGLNIINIKTSTRSFKKKFIYLPSAK